MPFGLQTVLEGIKLPYLAINNNLLDLQTFEEEPIEVQDVSDRLLTSDADSSVAMLVLQGVKVGVQVNVSQETTEVLEEVELVTPIVGSVLQEG